MICRCVFYGRLDDDRISIQRHAHARNSGIAVAKPPAEGVKHGLAQRVIIAVAAQTVAVRTGSQMIRRRLRPCERQMAARRTDAGQHVGQRVAQLLPAKTGKHNARTLRGLTQLHKARRVQNEDRSLKRRAYPRDERGLFPRQLYACIVCLPRDDYDGRGIFPRQPNKLQLTFRQFRAGGVFQCPAAIAVRQQTVRHDVCVCAQAVQDRDRAPRLNIRRAIGALQLPRAEYRHRDGRSILQRQQRQRAAHIAQQHHAPRCRCPRQQRVIRHSGRDVHKTLQNPQSGL